MRKEYVWNTYTGDRMRFNGAALFQVRKVCLSVFGNLCIMLLQWGRTLSSAESDVKPLMKPTRTARFNGAALFQVRKASFWVFYHATKKRMLQWGRTLSSAERTHCPAAHSSSKTLQWGRTLSSAESAESLRLHCSCQNRFNGAALFQVRKDFASPCVG